MKGAGPCPTGPTGTELGDLGREPRSPQSRANETRPRLAGLPPRGPVDLARTALWTEPRALHVDPWESHRSYRARAASSHRRRARIGAVRCQVFSPRICPPRRIDRRHESHALPACTRSWPPINAGVRPARKSRGSVGRAVLTKSTGPRGARLANLALFPGRPVVRRTRLATEVAELGTSGARPTEARGFRAGLQTVAGRAQRRWQTGSARQ